MDDRLFFEDQCFPIAEFVYSLIDWSRSGIRAGRKYSYDQSMNFEYQEAIVTFEKKGTYWLIRSIWEDIPGGVKVDDLDFTKTIEGFIHSASESIQDRWGVSLRDIAYQ